VYVRQSSPRRCWSNGESAELQYDWAPAVARVGHKAVLVMTRIQGQSADRGRRHGSHGSCWASESGLLGLVLGIEMSRLAGRGKEWYQLLEVCALFARCCSIRIGLYDPTNLQRRLLLGASKGR